eukprot:3854868-Rhodomonas_salina.2
MGRFVPGTLYALERRQRLSPLAAGTAAVGAPTHRTQLQRSSYAGPELLPGLGQCSCIHTPQLSTPTSETINIDPGATVMAKKMIPARASGGAQR